MSKASVMAAAGLVLWSGCGPQRDPSYRGSTGKSRDETAASVVLQAQSSSVSSADIDAFVRFSDLTGRWNRASAIFVRDYLDPNVAVGLWVQSASTQIGTLRAVWLEMQANSLAVKDSGIRALFDDFTRNYGAKLAAITSLHNAVANGDQQEEQAALRSLEAANAEAKTMAESMLERLRPYINPNTLREELTKRGRSLGELMKPRS